MSLALYLSMLPNVSFGLKDPLQPMAFAPLGNSIRSQTSLLFMKSNSSFMALYHKLDSLQLMACEKFSKSFLAQISVSCRYTT